MTSVSDRPSPILTTFPIRGGKAPRKRLSVPFRQYPKQRKCFKDLDNWDQEFFNRLSSVEKYLSDPFERLVTKAGIRYHFEKGERPATLVVESIGGKPCTPPPGCPWFNSPVQRSLLSIPTAHRATDKFEKTVHKDRMANQQDNLPLSTVVVRWHMVREEQDYHPSTLHEILKHFGPIRSIDYLSPTSARVIYENLFDSCQAVNEFCMGYPDNPLHCYWYHKTMTNKEFYKRGNGLWVNYNDLLPN